MNTVKIEHWKEAIENERETDIYNFNMLIREKAMKASKRSIMNLFLGRELTEVLKDLSKYQDENIDDSIRPYYISYFDHIALRFAKPSLEYYKKELEKVQKIKHLLNSDDVEVDFSTLEYIAKYYKK